MWTTPATHDAHRRRAEGDAAELPLIFPVHPRTRATWPVRHRPGPNITLVGPQAYMAFLNLWKDAAVVLTDSGGLQEETTALGVPCITIRENTERPVTVDEGSNVLAGTDPAASSSAKRARCCAARGNGPPPASVGRPGGRTHRHHSREGDGMNRPARLPEVTPAVPCSPAAATYCQPLPWAADRAEGKPSNGRIELMGCLIDNLSMEETLQSVEGFIQSGQPHQHGV
jgi:hypothetical protein